ncbi:hypothetical protein [Nocardioides bruguierae]|uniref:DUF1795 domain-containing protein n=1 Tax=Nocardioides bruguierae TaxID=2945102 RepID=A0A9X2D928_9ACTN|nr:hypothetical protein [Nocardioides bruguierae]MCM0620309.1 hypothetical protein [Nocardioides bruguierae]
MRARVLGIGVAAVLLCAAAGAGVGALTLEQDDGDAPTSLGTASPVPAAKPAFPRDRTVRVVEDPDYPALETDLPLERAAVGTTDFPVSLTVPQGWVRSDSTIGAVQFYPYSFPESANTYFIRIRLIGNQNISPRAAGDARVEALQGASDVLDFQLESRTYDSVTASYVAGEHRRVELDRYVARPGETAAFVWVGVVGREADRDGLTQLLDRLTRSLRFG